MNKNDGIKDTAACIACLLILSAILAWIGGIASKMGLM